MRPSGGVCGEPGRAAEGSFQRPAVEHAAQSLSRPGGAAAFQTFPRRRHRPGPTEPAGVCFAVCAGVPEQPGVGSRAALRAEGSRAGGARRDAALGRGSVHLRHAVTGCKDAERHYQRQFVRRKALLQTLRADDLSLLESFPKSWKSLEHPSAEETITDALYKVSFFIEAR
ncbi:unnamed protein product [Tetraodon nigroviridis]|uniref:(spotted green pufferfish) hypothetical protein n=1 Tax=Tetraodon nigroviridis TaxID=99883 RepID=Q4SVE4_TETNG|nr:unnamed protein product [Tetraodon nigroviridis]